MIEPDEQGRIYNSLIGVLNLDESDTTIINASVGQGKTYSILKAVETYFNEHPDSYIFIAVPYVSLVNQYFEQIVELGIPIDDIYRYEWLDPSNPNSSLEVQKSKRIHIVTVNCLLGNAGEDAVINSYIKREYLQNFSNFLKGDEYIYNGHLASPNELESLKRTNSLDIKKLQINREKNKKKAIFIYDEIHDAIHNFKQDNIFNLWHWADSIHKNIIVSATYNDASIPVIEYLSKLTHNRIHIIDSIKKIIRERQSELYLHFNGNKLYKSDDTTILDVVKDSLVRGKNIDILCYSKTLAEDLVKDNSEVRKILEEYIEPDDINLCVSELISNQRNVRGYSSRNRYNKYKANIGTTFKTGVSIEKENHSLIIIFPPDSTKNPFKNHYGIFSGGINDVIQALARQRIKGEIHLILPLPEAMDYSTLQGMSELQSMYFCYAYEDISEQTIVGERNLNSFNNTSFSDNIVNYKEFNTQTEIIRNKFEEYIGSIILPVITLSNNEEFKTPDLLGFRIQKGTKTIIRDKFLGSDLSAFITYCAFTNQFINCRLAGYNKPLKMFNGDTIERDLKKEYNNFIEELDNNVILDLNMRLYEDFLNYLFDGNKVYVDGNKITKGNYTIKKTILKILLEIETPEYFSLDDPYIQVFGSEFNHLNYLMFVLQEIYHAKRIDNNKEFSEAINQLYELRQKLIESLHSNRDSKYLKPIEQNNIFMELNIDAKNLLTNLSEQYPLFLENKTFRDVFKKSNGEIEKSLYNYLASTVGQFGKPRKYTFLDFNIKKLNSNIFDVPYS